MAKENLWINHGVRFPIRTAQVQVRRWETQDGGAACQIQRQNQAVPLDRRFHFRRGEVIDVAHMLVLQKKTGRTVETTKNIQCHCHMKG